MQNKSGYHGGGTILNPLQEHHKKLAEAAELNEIVGHNSKKSNPKHRPTGLELCNFIFQILYNYSRKMPAPEIPAFFDDITISRIKAHDDLFRWAITQGNNFDKASEAFCHEKMKNQTRPKNPGSKRRRNKKNKQKRKTH